MKRSAPPSGGLKECPCQDVRCIRRPGTGHAESVDFATCATHPGQQPDHAATQHNAIRADIILRFPRPAAGPAWRVDVARSWRAFSSQWCESEREPAPAVSGVLPAFRGQCRLHRRALRELPGRSGLGRRRMAHLFRFVQGPRSRRCAAFGGHREDRTGAAAEWPCLRCRGRRRSSDEQAHKQAAVRKLVTAYRSRGHLGAQLDPLDDHTFPASDLEAMGLLPRPSAPDLDPAFHGLTDADLDPEFSTGSLARRRSDSSCATCSRILRRRTPDTIGAEFMHISDAEQRRWMHEQFEARRRQFGVHRRRARHAFSSS